MNIIIAGGGKVGEYLASVMLKSGNTVSIIEKNAETAERISIQLRGDYMVILGDGCDSRYQEDAGIRRADVFVAATGHDDDNLVACEIAQRIFNVSRCIARVNNPRNLRVFQMVGIESVSATTLIADLIEQEALLGGVGVVTSLTQDNVALSEMKIPKMREHDDEEGVPISSIDLPVGALIVAVSNADGFTVADEDVTVFPDDKVVVMADVDVLPDVRHAVKAL